MNFRKSALRILLLTCFLLLVAWISLQLLVNGWDIEILLRKAQEKIGLSWEDVTRFNREQVMPQERLSDHVHYYDRVHHLLINTHDGAAVSKELDKYREEYAPKEKKQDLPGIDTPKVSRQHKRRGR